VDAHAVALVPHPVALDQVLAAPGPGEGKGRQDQGHRQASGRRPKWVTASGRAHQASVVMAVAMATTMKNRMMPTLKNSIRSTKV
jgi:hypothetical protein